MILGCINGTLPDFEVGEIVEDDALKLAIVSNKTTVVFRNTDRHLIFVVFGRVDSKKELRVFVDDCATDQEYIYKAYLKWGKDCVSHLLGDWFFVAYNTQSKELFMARDQNGKGELFYRKTADGFWFSDSLNAITLAKKELNPVYVAATLSRWQYKDYGRETLFKGVMQLVPGHTLTYHAGSVRTAKYWFPENVAYKHYANTQDYADEMLEIVKEAIRCRIPESLKVASMLSGGYDSGTTSYLTAELLGNAPLVTFSHVRLHDSYPLSYPEMMNDERGNINAVVAARANIQSIQLQSAHISPMDGIERYVHNFNVIPPNSVNLFWMTDIYEQSSAMGFDALFAASFGNLALSYRGNKLLLPMPLGLRALKLKILRPALRNYLEYKRFAGKLADDFLNRQVLDEFSIRQDILLNRRAMHYIFTSKKEEILHLIDKTHRLRISAADSPFTCELRDPSADIRIVEHCLAIPNKFFFNEKRENKRVIRHMMEGRLPDKVLYEKRTGLQAADIFMRLHAEIDRVEAYCNRFEKNPKFSFFIDVPKLKNTIGLVKAQKVTHAAIMNDIMRAMTLGVFLEQNKF